MLNGRRGLPVSSTIRKKTYVFAVFRPDLMKRSSSFLEEALDLLSERLLDRG